MSDKEKQCARAIQRETGMPYQGALRIVRGEVRPIPQVTDCLIQHAVALMPEKLQKRMPELGQPAEGKPAPKPCTCARCDP